ncbi:MAG: glycosyltransferase family 9 protein [Gammaproteobacteria bacterium]
MRPDREKPVVMVYVNGDALGDSLLKLPALMALRSAFPGHYITWFAGRGRSIFANTFSPLVTGAVDKVQDSIRLGMSWRELFSSPLRNCYYDIIIDTQSYIRTTLILKKVPHGTFVSSAASFYFSDHKPAWPRQQAGPVYQRILQLVQLACGREIQPDFTLNLPQEYREIAKDLLPDGRPYVGFAPGAGQRVKCWPLERFIELGRRQAECGRQPVYFLGPQETEWMSSIRAELPDALFPEQSEKARGNGGPLLTIALAERISAGVANDSGTGHIMANAGQPLISLFGPSSIEKFAGNYPNKKILSASNYGGTDMHLIPVEEVNQALDSFFE